jgi:putative photosynthetic complex assembly protein 2
MGHLALAVLAAIAAWWASTAAIIVLCALPRRSFAGLMTGASLFAAAAVLVLSHTAQSATPQASYLGFFCALTIWAWIEMSFLTGLVTGPRSEPCPAEARGWTRFRLAIEALLWHELAILALGALVVAVTFRAPNQTGTLAFLILAAMRLSAKLNIFLGVPNLTDEFLPARLAYLKSYFRKSDASILFPVSLLLSCIAAAVLFRRAESAGVAEAVGLSLLLALIGLAVLEHIFMIMPLPDAALWRWAVPASQPGRDGRLENNDGL